jgi:hypothetical protein
MRFTKWDYLAFPIVAALAIGVFYGALRLVGFFGLGILGLVIGFIAVRMDLERDGASSDPKVLEEQFKTRDRMSRAERADLHAAQLAQLKSRSSSRRSWRRGSSSSASGFTSCCDGLIPRHA